MSDKLVKEFLGFSELREGEAKDQPGRKIIYLNLLYAGGRFNVQASASFEVYKTDGTSSLRHIPTGKIYPADKPFIAVMEGAIINAIAFKRSQDVFSPRSLVNIEPIPSGAAPLPKMEEKKK